MRVRCMVLNATFNNISAILWQSVLLVEETERSGENHQPVAINWQMLSHKIVSSTPRMCGVRSHNVSGDRNWLQIQLPCDHYHDGSRIKEGMNSNIKKYIRNLHIFNYFVHFMICPLKSIINNGKTIMIIKSCC